MAWWSRTGGLQSELPKKSVPKGIWTKCDKCAATLYDPELDEHARVCMHCGHHLRMPTDGRIVYSLDEGSWVEHDLNLESTDALGFRVDGKKYRDSIKSAIKKVGPGDAYRAGTASIDGFAVEAGFFVFEFMGGSMGSVVGEKITRQFERALEHKRPAVMFCASGGARMQEGVLSLMQMAKTSAARSRLREAHVPYISVLLHPTTGGVAASVAMLGDIILAEPDALIGFAGPRVIEQTIRQQLPPGFQRSEFLLEHGMVDMVVPRKDMKKTLARMLGWFAGTGVVAAVSPDGPNGAADAAAAERAVAEARRSAAELELASTDAVVDAADESDDDLEPV
jgi:acetyl-CoA carboxylase carboxyl transferase subunit beta